MRLCVISDHNLQITFHVGSDQVTPETIAMFTQFAQSPLGQSNSASSIIVMLISLILSSIVVILNQFVEAQGKII